MKLIALFFVLLAILIAVASCTKDKSIVQSESSSPDFSDNDLFSIVSDTIGRKYYKNDPNILSPAGGSPHGSFRFWFNAKAYAVLDTSGKLPVSGIFPDSSLLVKEVVFPLFDSIPLFAVMYKLNEKWKWAEYELDGDVIYSVNTDPSACISCHSNSPNRDLVRTFDLH